MSLKLRYNGSVFPTEVHGHTLTIYAGTHSVSVDLPFLNGDFPIDNTKFPVSNIMGYFENDSEIVVMRFDGTATKYTKNLEVIGFTSFDKDIIYDNFVHMQVGCVGKGISKGKTEMHLLTVLYKLHDVDELIFEAPGDFEHIVIKPEENPEYLNDCLKGTEFFPRLEMVGDNLYREDGGRYYIKGYPVKAGRYVVI